MSDKLLGVLAAIGAAIGIYYVIETPEGKKIISNIHSNIHNIIPASNIHDVVYQGIPPTGVTPKGVCKPGHYLDQTDGILHCVDPAGAKELSPNVKYFEPQWQNAWANPLVQETTPSHIISSVNPIIKKEEEKDKEKKKKRHLEPSKEKGPTAQVECPSDLSKLKCGSNCYKDGKLWKITCSEKEREELFPKKKRQPLYIPPNYPAAVTVDPYPETDTSDETDVGGVPKGGGELPSLDINPGQTQIQPTVPVTSPTPIAGGQVFYPFKPGDQAVRRGFADDFNSDGCRRVHYGSGSYGWTCRWQASDADMRRNIGENGYKIETDLHIGPHKKGLENDKEISITSGGPGSASGTQNCCGFTTRINIDTGEFQLEAEGPAKTEKQFCKGRACTGGGASSIARVVNGKRQPLYGENIKLTWIVTKRGGKATYQAIATGPGGTITAVLPSPQVRGQDLIPFHYIRADKIADDSHRVRVDTADMKAMDFGNPKVTVIPAQAYFGDDGYIEDEDFLI